MKETPTVVNLTSICRAFQTTYKLAKRTSSGLHSFQIAKIVIFPSGEINFGGSSTRIYGGVLGTGMEVPTMAFMISLTRHIVGISVGRENLSIVVGTFASPLPFCAPIILDFVAHIFSIPSTSWLFYMSSLEQA